MIIDFTIKNYRSIKDEVTLSAFATNIKEFPQSVFQSDKEKKIKILNTTVIYGANASGKSNILEAIGAFKELIVLSTDLKIGEKIPSYKPFRLAEGWDKDPTEFEIEFVVNKRVRYKYFVSFNARMILKETLSFFPKGSEAVLFNREINKKIHFGGYFKGPAKAVESQLLANNLFLSKAANSNNKQMEEVYLFFKNTAKMYPTRTIGLPTLSFTTRACLEEEAYINKEVIQDFLRVADVGIESFDIEEKTIDPNEYVPSNFPEELKKVIIDSVRYTPRMFHKKFHNDNEAGVVPFDLGEESTGTVKLYNLSAVIIQTLHNGDVLIIDELNSSLHPLLSQFIINLFQDAKSNPNKAQLIITTHDTTLLSQDLLRRDQIWLVEKDSYGATSLYSLSDFDYREVRSSIPFDRWYLSGRFGALPVIGDFNRWFEYAKKEKE